MSIHVALHHRTHYRYDRPIELGPQTVRLRPAPHCRTRILSYSLKVQPGEHFLNWQQDPQANFLARLVVPERTSEFVVEVDLVAEMAVHNPFDFFLEPAAERFPFSYDAALDHELEPFRRRLPGTSRFAAYFDDIRSTLLSKNGAAESPRTVQFLVDLNVRLHGDVRYLIRLEPGVQTPDETLEKGSGSCRDSAWMLCQLLREFGLASRFVSGYLIQLTADVKALDGPSGTAVDFTDLHAWCEVYLPGAGWIGLDPTSGLFAGEGHIPLAATADPQGAAPISGAVEACQTTFHHEMTVTRIFESPRVTLPYTDAQWSRIEALGDAVDAELVRGDVRLTMGGEPTFVSIDDMEAAEWNTAALGPDKIRMACGLIERLKPRFAPKGFLHYGQGKWYPGEALPRWAYACYWRTDGGAIWERPELFADPTRDYGFGDAEASRFIRALAVRLGLDAEQTMPAYEDAFYYCWKERKLPSNVDPSDSKLGNEQERARLARLFEKGLDEVAGYLLPLRRVVRGKSTAWDSTSWFLRTERCCLLPGDSPMGLRLPLESQPWVKAADYPHLVERDPLEDRPPLGEETKAPAAAAVAGATARRKPPARGESADWIARTALCIEARSGRLHVFLPPVARLEDYLDLLAAVEATAAELSLPVVLEGYPPPDDHRLTVLKLTPDPGVLEVNVQPARSWREMIELTELVYEQARQSRLGTEKFMVDGRHTGTGGGNHIVLGGPTPADSPFLRRPHLLRSLLSYWQNHPSLSYLFSGLFIGPTSQHPRIDEARNDSLHELEIAFAQIPEKDECPPWLVDRLFRNLLVDSTGNTHRTEFCIDKLYAPDSATGRLGLLELRAFEMPPHARMSLAQQLLLRTLVARFWRKPYKQSLVRWGTAIHDRWMLPHFVWSDFCEVVADLRDEGYAIDAGWFAPHFEFRFPQIGDLDVRGVHLELRTALEPWHVLGEEAGAGGTARYVDSSLERLQVKVQGLTDSRYVVTAQGWALPLRPTGVSGEAVCGLRYRAWQPPNCLHPTIGVHVPLVFNLVDTWSERSVAGCTYHVSHPGGVAYETFPVNAYEAESRRLSRFFRSGHTPGKVAPRVAAASSDFPFTLDLRAARER
jgi:uncharacterized protein (DUF2126 family)/transglutaminase-like putative cysteine protease